MSTETPAPSAPEAQTLPPGDASDGGGGLDLDAAADEIAEGVGVELPEMDSPEATGEDAPTPAPKDANAQPATPAPVAPVDDKAGEAPSAWRPEAKAAWAALPPVVREEIAKREDDVLKGITQYKTASDVGNRFTDIVAADLPNYQKVGANIWDVSREALTAHAILSFGTPEEKFQAIVDICQRVGLDPRALAQGQLAINPNVQAAEERLRRLEAGNAEVVSRLKEVQVEKLATELEEFGNDPAHPYFGEVLDEMRTLFSTGQARTLKEAYSKAVWMNPVTRQKEIDRQAQERVAAAERARTERNSKARKASSANVRSTETRGRTTSPLGSIDETLAETLAEINSRETG